MTQSNVEPQLLAAVADNDVERVAELLRTGMRVDYHIDYGDNEAVSPLWLASTRRHAQIVELLIEASAEVNEADTAGHTLLMDAVISGDATVVSLLLQAGADVNACDWEGGTALMDAAIVGNVEIMTLLLNHGAEVNARTSNLNPECYGGGTPLNAAVRSGNIDAVRLLLDRGADINEADDAGQTPLMYAVQILHTTRRGSVEMVALLLERGARVDPRDIYSATAESEAKRHGLSEVARLIRTHRRETFKMTHD